MVAGKETTLLKVNARGEVERSFSTKPLQEVEQILVVFDPRAQMSWFGKLKTLVEDFQDKTQTFLLMPSLSSSPECLLCAELGLILTSTTIVGPEEKLCLVRVDDYMHHGDAIITSMVETWLSIPFVHALHPKLNPKP